MYLMDQYDSALEEILKRGVEKKDRTGVGTISIAGMQRTYPLNKGEYYKNGDYECVFPLVTRRKLFPKAVFAELLWFLSGSTYNQDLEALGAKFWGKWCDEENPKYRALREKFGYEPGDFGPIYGWQLRHFGADYISYRREQSLYRRQATVLAKLTEAFKADSQKEEVLKLLRENGQKLKAEILQKGLTTVEEIIGSYAHSGNCREPLPGGFDQLKFMIDTLKKDPFGSNGRRCLFSLWNPPDLEKMALPPCHYTYQAIADGNGGLTGILTQRSCDFPVGVPANIQFYSTLTIMLAQQCGMNPVELVHNTNDSHIYLDQIDAVKEYLGREKPDSPMVRVRKAEDIYSYAMTDFEVKGYAPLDRIDVPVAV